MQDAKCCKVKPYSEVPGIFPAFAHKNAQASGQLQNDERESNNSLDAANG
jgi:hypothetical protein